MKSHNLCDQQARLYHAPQKAEQSGRDQRAGCTVLEGVIWSNLWLAPPSALAGVRHQ